MTDEPSRPSRRARQVVQQDQSREHASVDAYPDAPPDPRPRVLFTVAFESTQALDGEQVDTDGLSVKEVARALAFCGKFGKWLGDRLLAADTALDARLGGAVDAR